MLTEVHSRGDAGTASFMSDERSVKRAFDVVFVSMPYAAVERPSMALGTLAAALGAASITTKTIHANLYFAESIGPAYYEIVNNSDITLQIGEWTFSEAAFGAGLDTEPFFEGLIQAGFPEKGLRDWLSSLRSHAAAFVDETARRVLEGRPRIVGCSSVFQQQCASLALLRRIRELDPGVVTMLGGANCESEMGVATHRTAPWVDYVVSGEAEGLIVDLCRAVFAEGRHVPPARWPMGVIGPAARDEASALAGARPPRGLIRDLDELPVPDFDDYFDQIKTSPLLDNIIVGIPIETSRGCWWGAKHHCTFCGLNGEGMGFRAKSQDRVKREVAYLADRHGRARFMAVDNILDPKYFKEVLPFLAEDGGMLWFYETKANLSRAQVAQLSSAGVRWIQPGIEALDDDVLALLKKGCSTAINIQLLKWSYGYGIWIMWNHLYGAPGEEPGWYDRAADLIPLIVHLQPPVGGVPTRIRFDRFSPYFNDPGAFGLDLQPCWGYGQAYPQSPDDLAKRAYFFRDAKAAVAPPIRLMGEMRRWAELFYAAGNGTASTPRRSASAPVLEIAEDGARLAIRDTRPCAVAPLHRLDEVETLVVRACDAVRGMDQLVEMIRAKGQNFSEVEIRAARDRLVERKLVVDFDGKLLCLATDRDPVPYRPFTDFAGGMLLMKPRPRPVPVEDHLDPPLRTLFAAFPA